MSNLIDERYESVWTAINPLGNDFVRLITCHQRITQIVQQILTTDCHQYPGCSWTVNTLNINQTIRILHRHQLETFSFENEPTHTKITVSGWRKTPHPNKTTTTADERGNGRLTQLLLEFFDVRYFLVSTWYAVSITTFGTAHHYVPNLRLGR